MNKTDKEKNNLSKPPSVENNTNFAHLIQNKRLSSNLFLVKTAFFATILPASGLIIVLSYFYLFWLIAVIGLVTLITLWRFKDDDTYLSALCFMSVFISLYGLFGVLIQWL